MKVESVLGDWYDENCYVVSENGHALIIDPGAKVDKVLPLLDGLKVDGILLTHGHFDHTLYLSNFVEKFRCKVYGSDCVEKTLANHKLNQAEEWEEKNVKVDALSGDGKVEIGKFEIEYFSTPGHSPCGMCYKIGDDFFAGDTLFYSGIGRLDLVGCDKQSMINSLEKLSNVPFQMLYSGHGNSSDYARQKRNIAAYYKFLSR